MEEQKNRIFACPSCLMVAVIVIVAAAAIAVVLW